jgi:hypothetical protein
MSPASTYESEKALFRCGSRMSFRQVRNPHMKKSDVRMVSGTR